jgi:ribosomal protein L21E
MKLTRAITATEEITLPAYFQNETGTQHVAILAPDHMLDVKTFGVGRCMIAVHPVPDGFTLNGLLRLQESQFWYAVNPLIDSIRETATEHLTAKPIPFTVHDKDVVIHDAIRPFQVGDVVKVGKVDKAWENYVDELDEYTGQTGSVMSIDENGEVRVYFVDASYWYYPASALTLVKAAQ